MNDLQNTSTQTPIEWGGQRVITTALLAEVYETDANNVKNNFNRNKNKFIEGKHYFLLQGEELKAFKNLVIDNDLVDKRTPQLYLWTNRGANRHCKILDTDKAWEQFDNLEETYFKVKQEVIDYSQLSPSLQMAKALLQSQAELELEQKRQAKEITEVKQTVETMKEILTEPIGDWKAEINSRVREISIKSGVDYQTLYGQLYGELETTAHCSLKRLQDNKKARMEKAGNTKTAIKDATTKIAIIFEKPQLKAIFENIVKRYAMKYCA